MIYSKNTKENYSQKAKKVDLVGYEGENGRFWAIYSPCGSLVRTEFSRRPDSWASGTCVTVTLVRTK